MIYVSAPGRGTQSTEIHKLVFADEDTRRRPLLVQVVWVTQQSANSWKIVCQLDQPLCEFEVHDLR